MARLATSLRGPLGGLFADCYHWADPTRLDPTDSAREMQTITTLRFLEK